MIFTLLLHELQLYYHSSTNTSWPLPLIITLLYSSTDWHTARSVKYKQRIPTNIIQYSRMSLWSGEQYGLPALVIQCPLWKGWVAQDQHAIILHPLIHRVWLRCGICCIRGHDKYLSITYDSHTACMTKYPYDHLQPANHVCNQHFI